MSEIVIENALRDAANDILRWAGSKQNNGPFSDEAYRTCVHIASALNIAADRIDESIEDRGA